MAALHSISSRIVKSENTELINRAYGNVVKALLKTGLQAIEGGELNENIPCVKAVKAVKKMHGKEIKKWISNTVFSSSSQEEGEQVVGGLDWGFDQRDEF